MRELASIRKDINSVDSAIRELFLLRMSLAHEVAETKAQSDDKIYKPDREAEIIEQRSAGMEEEIRLKYIALLQSMIRASREYQYSEILRQTPEKFPFYPAETLAKPKTVFYQGVPGAYQELAARALFPRCEPQNVPTWEQVFQSVRDGKADIGVILGSGLGDYAEALEDAVKLPYSEIPGFPRSTVAGHAGMWCCGTLYGKRVVMMQGRFHYYEGYGMKDVTLPVRVMQKIGVKTLIVTNAAGGVNLGYHPGELMVIGDMFSMTAQNPLIGPNLDAFGPRFPDMSCAFDKELRALAHECANEQGFALREGVYAQMTGPTYETPAEIRMLRTLGADAVGMSTVPEVIVARHGGMRVLGISCITNMAAGILDQPLNHAEVTETANRVKGQFRNLLDRIIEKM